MDIAKVTSKGQITIPKSVRDDLELEPGSKVLFVKSGDSWRVLSSEVASTPPSPQRETSDEIKSRFMTEIAAEYGLEYPLKTDQSRPIGELLDELREGFKGVAEEQEWTTEQDVADYIRAMREEDQD